jgi:hypothetical protein
MADYCINNHLITTSTDRRPGNGGCAECHREANRILRQKNSAALAVVRAFEAAGVQFQNNGEPLPAELVARQLVEMYGHSVN